MADKRFGWVRQNPDQRDIPLRVPQHVLEALPSFTDLSTPPLTFPFEPAWDQTDLGACSAFASGADLVFAALKQDNLTNVSKPSCLFIYYATRKVMGTIGYDSGADNRSLMKALNQYGWCDEGDWPYLTNKFAVVPPQGCWDNAAKRKITKYLAVDQDLDTMRGCLAAGDPFVFGFTVYDSLMSDAVARTGVVPMPSRRERVRGGHDVLLCGSTTDERPGVKPGNRWPARTWKLKGSWGDWGDGGYFYLPWEYGTNANLSSDFWTVQSSSYAPPQPGPLPISNQTIVFPSTVTFSAGTYNLVPKP